MGMGIFCLCSCSSNSKTDAETVSEHVRAVESATVEYYTPQSYTPATSQAVPETGRSSQSGASTRADAFKLAFSTGKQIGYSDGLRGVNECYLAASAYSDEWIKQAFIQGYELGQAEAGSNAVSPDYDEFDYGDELCFADEEY